jgi:hypothetical protein
MIKRVVVIIIASIMFQGCRSSVNNNTNPAKILDKTFYANFNQTPLKEAVEFLNKKYGLKIRLSCDVEEMKNLKVSMNADDGIPLENLMDNLTQAAGKENNKRLNWQINGENIIIYELKQ